MSAPVGSTRSAGGALSGPRRAGAAVLFLVALPAVTSAMLDAGWRATPASPVLVVLAVVVVAALVGGAWVGLPAALLGAVVLNWFFTPPYASLAVDSTGRLLVLAVYLTVAVVVSAVAAVAAARAADAGRARAEARALSALAGASLAEDATLTDLLERIRTTFHLREVRLLETDPDGAEVVAERVGAAHGAGELGARATEDEAELRVEAAPGVAVSAWGPPLLAQDRRVMAALAAAAATALQGRRLAEQARGAAQLAAAEEMRAALLAAVGHDLRTPLAAIKAAASSLRQVDVTFTDAERAELLEMVETSTDRLRTLVANLLDASRLRAGALVVHPEPTGVDEVMAPVLSALSPPERARTHLTVPADLPDVCADVVLLERVLANLVDNALRYSPAPAPVTVRASATGGEVVCDVVDHGRGVPAGCREELFAPFQRLGDQVPGGIGLGLSVARGFTEAMGGSLHALDTAGGGLTMRLRLPPAQPRATP